MSIASSALRLCLAMGREPEIAEETVIVSRVVPARHAAIENAYFGPSEPVRALPRLASAERAAARRRTPSAIALASSEPRGAAGLTSASALTVCC